MIQALTNHARVNDIMLVMIFCWLLEGYRAFIGLAALGYMAWLAMQRWVDFHDLLADHKWLGRDNDVLRRENDMLHAALKRLNLENDCLQRHILTFHTDQLAMNITNKGHLVRHNNFVDMLHEFNAILMQEFRHLKYLQERWNDIRMKYFDAYKRMTFINMVGVPELLKHISFGNECLLDLLNVELVDGVYRCRTFPNTEIKFLKAHEQFPDGATPLEPIFNPFMPRPKLVQCGGFTYM